MSKIKLKYYKFMFNLMANIIDKKASKEPYKHNQLISELHMYYAMKIWRCK